MCAHVLGIRLLRCGGEAHEVDEQHRDDLPLLAGSRLSFGECGATRRAEARPLGVLCRADWTGNHAQSLRRHDSGA
jgi:hypothetical protein